MFSPLEAPPSPASAGCPTPPSHAPRTSTPPSRGGLILLSFLLPAPVDAGASLDQSEQRQGFTFFRCHTNMVLCYHPLIILLLFSNKPFPKLKTTTLLFSSLFCWCLGGSSGFGQGQVIFAGLYQVSVEQAGSLVIGWPRLASLICLAFGSLKTGDRWISSV